MLPLLLFNYINPSYIGSDKRVYHNNPLIRIDTLTPRFLRLRQRSVIVVGILQRTSQPPCKIIPRFHNSLNVKPMFLVPIFHSTAYAVTLAVIAEPAATTINVMLASLAIFSSLAVLHHSTIQCGFSMCGHMLTGSCLKISEAKSSMFTRRSKLRCSSNVARHHSSTSESL